MYNIYKFNKNDDSINSRFQQNLNLLRLDFTENELFEKKFVTVDMEEESNVFHNKINDKLNNIGFLSDDFSESRPSGQLSIQFFEYLKTYSSHIGIYFYTNSSNLVSNRFEKFAIIRKSPKNTNLRNMIIKDKIDILFDMQGHMSNNYNDILHSKIAPIMCHWLGYPGTIGIHTIDYIFADPIIIPKESQYFYREKIAYFPICYQPNNAEKIVRNTIYKDIYGIPEDKFVFCNFNSDYKLDRKMWFVMLEILKRTPNSVLVFTISSPIQYSLKTTLMRDASNYGINNNQLICVKIIDITEHIKRLSTCNLGLDPFRLNGHTTCSDLIAAGTPFITYPGHTYQNRVAKSILYSMNLQELCVDSFSDYIDLAVKLSTNKIYYQKIKNILIQNREKVMFNTQMYTNHFVHIIHNIWKNNFSIKKKQIDYIWIFYINKDSPGNNIIITNKRNKNLYKLAINTPGCVGYTTNGYLKHTLMDINSLTKLEDSSNQYQNGLWVKEPLKEYNITKFGNNHLNKKFRWEFHPNMDSPGGNIITVPQRNQKLRDIAEKNIDCAGFNLKGEIKICIKQKDKWIEDHDNGLWIKHEVLFDHSNNIDNKEYNLELIIYYDKITTFKKYYNIVKKFNEKLYLNKKLLIFIPENMLYIKIITNRIKYNHNIYTYLFKNNENYNVEEICKKIFSTSTVLLN